MERAVEYVDLFLYDYKESDAERHKRFTGVYPDIILDNLRFLAESAKRIVLGCPIIPGFNDSTEHLDSIARIAERYDSVIRVDVEPYHPLGRAKAELLGKDYALSELGITPPDIAEGWIERIRSKTGCEVGLG